MSEYIPTIGLEIHAELKTKTKMFCSSRNDSGETKPNVNICPVCLAHPGTLPVINREAVKHVLRVGIALGGNLADYTEFDRKNYFYPDLPKGYQISQYEYPLVSGGVLNGVAITRVHLEEDTASSIHPEGKSATSYLPAEASAQAGGAGDEATTVIDFNRAGVPLMELVTEPVIKSSEEAGVFARELQLLLRYLGASEANMEQGEMRVEANVSMSTKNEDGSTNFGTKVEIKNLNSFRAMERAVAHEIKRQSELLKMGEKVKQETRGWDEAKQATFSQRPKEGSADYRYFPDPDLPSLRISEIGEFSEHTLSQAMVELPWKRRERYVGMGIKVEHANILTAEPMLASYFDQVVTLIAPPVTPQAAANYAVNDLLSLIRDTDSRDAEIRDDIEISPSNFAKILTLVAGKRISSRVAKDLIRMCLESGGDPEELAEEKGLFTLEETSELQQIVDHVLASNISVVGDYRKGKASALEYLVGQGMRQTRGAADPETLREMIRSKIG
ncbi:Asp-tRNA(Asn)/Glu-tRNA(Gln) amidotransferase subunit GatB [Candidatus Kaiserbacteria bacterium]|nr:Asp-tRNA(Asn)/Glu-tRNA(Gln) amidotransferase subunit GatB [Candidatus Kaiserbacteria bacterium]